MVADEKITKENVSPLVSRAIRIKPLGHKFPKLAVNRLTFQKFRPLSDRLDKLRDFAFTLNVRLMSREQNIGNGSIAPDLWARVLRPFQ